MLNRILFKQIDNSPLILFRILFGILISLECYGAILTGWVNRILVAPQFTFTFIGFEWLQPLPGNGMYWYFIVMGSLGLLIALGYKYRLAIISFTVLWTAVYLMQKTAYNNHYYLLILISFIMCFLPANRSHSLDCRKHPELRTNTMGAYVKWVFVIQLFIVYTFASIAKFYPDWLNFSFIKILMHGKEEYYLIGNFLQLPWVHKIIGLTGIVFDMLVIPALLWKPTRKFAFIASIFFHLFNSVVLQIGIFPYLSLAFTVFFFEPETIRRIFFKKKPPYQGYDILIPHRTKLVLTFAGLYFAVQLLLPLRHHFIQGDVLWTEEGHRLSWRMMLRSRAGNVSFKVVNKKSGAIENINLNKYLTKSQRSKIGAYPDFIWQFAQRIKKDNTKIGEDVAVYVKSGIRINGRALQPFIDPDVDIAAEPWDHFRHHKWILPPEE
ncbi:MAG: HTTM domain-containing protein [Eudoraea sp.]|nr:HTTM domain-containing protein [Eudoraea sp.]